MYVLIYGLPHEAHSVHTLITPRDWPRAPDVNRHAGRGGERCRGGSSRNSRHHRCPVRPFPPRHARALPLSLSLSLSVSLNAVKHEHWLFASTRGMTVEALYRALVYTACLKETDTGFLYCKHARRSEASTRGCDAVAVKRPHDVASRTTRAVYQTKASSGQHGSCICAKDRLIDAHLYAQREQGLNESS